MEVIQDDTEYFIGPFATEGEALSHLELLQPADKKPKKRSHGERVDNVVKQLKQHGIHIDDDGESTDAPEVAAEGTAGAEIRPIKNPTYDLQPVEFENAIEVPEPDSEKEPFPDPPPPVDPEPVHFEGEHRPEPEAA